MAHFAKVNEQNIVVDVIVAEQEYIDTLDGTWLQTSYNTHAGKHYDPKTGEEDGGTPFRKNYACIGYKYDADRDAFIPERNFASWVLDENACRWVAPIPRPELTEEQFDNGQYYMWIESEHEADNTQGWVLVGSGL